MTFELGLAALWTDRRGTISIASAAVLPMVIACAALAVDLGSVYLERRTSQSIADLAAINAAAYPDTATAAARATLSANQLASVKELIVTKGHYSPDPAVAPFSRFKPGIEPFNAVRVEFANDARLYFASAFRSRLPEYRVSATASIANRAMYSVGTRLAAVRDGLANQVLSSLVGTQISLSAMDYQALIDANVRIDDALNAVSGELNLTGASYDKVIDSKISLALFGRALSEAAERSGDKVTEAALTVLANQLADSPRAFELRRILDLGNLGALTSGERTQSLSARLNAFDMLRAAAMVANGVHQVAVDLRLDVPGISRASLSIAIGERQQFSAFAAVGEPGSHVRTAQLKLRLVVEIGGSGLLAATSIRLPLYVEAAYADAKLADVVCDAGRGGPRAAVAVQPGVARAAIAEVSDSQLNGSSRGFKLTRARIVTTPLAAVTGLSEIAAGNLSATTLEFSEDDVDSGRVRRVETTDALSSLLTSLLTRLDLDVHALGLGLGLPALEKAVASQLLAVAAPLDGALHTILATLGVHLGEADVRVHAIGCAGAVLID